MSADEEAVGPEESGDDMASGPVHVSREHSDALAEHYKRWFGCENQFLYHERFSKAVHLDTLIYPATPDRPFITAATIGMSALPFDPDCECKGNNERSELFMYLDPNWDFGSNIGYIPISLLHYVARFPHLEHDHFGPGLSYQAENRPVAEGSLLTDLFVRQPVLENLDGTMEDFAHVNLPGGGICHLYWLIPITVAECYLKRSEGIRAINERLTDNGYVIFDVDRPCYVEPENRAQRRAREKAQRLRAKRTPVKSVYDVECMMCSGRGQHNHD